MANKILPTGIGQELIKTDRIVNRYYVTEGRGMNIDVVRDAAIKREECFQAIEGHFGTGTGFLAQQDKLFRREQIEGLGINPTTLEAIR